MILRPNDVCYAPEYDQIVVIEDKLPMYQGSVFVRYKEKRSHQPMKSFPVSAILSLSHLFKLGKL